MFGDIHASVMNILQEPSPSYSDSPVHLSNPQ